MSVYCSSNLHTTLEDHRLNEPTLTLSPASGNDPLDSSTPTPHMSSSAYVSSTNSFEATATALEHNLDHQWQWAEEAPTPRGLAVIDAQQALFEPFIGVAAETHDTSVTIEDTMIQEYSHPMGRSSPSHSEDRLGDVSPSLSSASIHIPASGCSYSPDALLHYSRNPVNLVLDSIIPEIAPHIVISPPAYEWDEYIVPAMNRVEYHCQVQDFLTVPQPTRPFTAVDFWPSCETSDLSAKSLSNSAPPSPISPSEMESSGVRVRKRRKPSGFNRSRFDKLIDFTSWERHTHPDVLKAVHRRLYSLNASNAAMLEAPSWRTVYDEPDWHCAADKPFRWTDPAHAIMKQLSAFRGTLILDSIRPFSSPHIVINAAAPPNPWIGWGNVPNQQDAAWGRALTVPGAPAANIPDSGGSDDTASDTTDWSPDAEQDGYGDEESVQMTEYYVQTEWNSGVKDNPDIDSDNVVTVEVLEVGASDSDPEESCDSRPETPGPGTPLDHPLYMPLALAFTEPLVHKTGDENHTLQGHRLHTSIHRRAASA